MPVSCYGILKCFFFGNTYCKLSLSIDSLYISLVLNYILIIYSFNARTKNHPADINNGKPIYIYVFFSLYLLELVLIFAELVNKFHLLLFEID
jgi:hypothetical protein